MPREVTLPALGETLVLDRQPYRVTHVSTFEFAGATRYDVFLKRPKGQVEYHAVLYENGTYSKVHPIP